MTSVAKPYFFLAYEVLSDDQKRQIYDHYGEDGLRRPGEQPHFHDPFDIFSRYVFLTRTILEVDYLNFFQIRWRVLREFWRCHR